VDQTLTLAFGASNYADKIDWVFWYVTAISAVLMVGITGVMAWFVYRYHHSRSPKPENVPDSTALEMTWTILPTILVMTMFWFGWKYFKELRNREGAELVVIVTGSQWQWRYMYVDEKGQKKFEIIPDEEEKKGDVDELVLPIGKKVELKLASTDVLHAFYVPAFRLKEDAVPGRETYLAFTPTLEGVYPVFCAEYCGGEGDRGKRDGHWSMLSRVRVVSQAEFKAYYDSNGAVRLWKTQKPGGPAAGLGEPEGFRVLLRNNCFTCHSTDGTNRPDGPTFRGLYGSKRRIVKGGDVATVDANEDYLRRAITDPDDEIVEDYFRKTGPMAARKDLSESDMKAILDYLKELR